MSLRLTRNSIACDEKLHARCVWIGDWRFGVIQAAGITGGHRFKTRSVASLLRSGFAVIPVVPITSIVEYRLRELYGTTEKDC